MNRRMMEKALSQIDDRFVQESLEKVSAENKGKSLTRRKLRNFCEGVARDGLQVV